MRLVPDNPFAKICLALAISAAGIWLVVVLSRPRPSEANRVVSHGGFSVIRPDGWNANMRRLGAPTTGPSLIRDFIELSPEKYMGIPPSISVRRFVHAPDDQFYADKQFVDGFFQGQKAKVLTKHDKHRYTQEAIFERDGQWFGVGMVMSLADSVRLDEWWRFVETFRYPEPGYKQVDNERLQSTSAPTSEPYVMPQIDRVGDQ